MSELFDTRRYLTNFDSWRTGHIVTDVLVIGGGAAGMRAAIEAAAHAKHVLLVCKKNLHESATSYAQGGIANVRLESDSPQKHIRDTLHVGCGLNRPDVVEFVVNNANRRIDELIQWGIQFDHADGQLALTREGGHSAQRILHCDGDATGRELARVLIEKLHSTNNLRVFENCFLIDLLTHERRCVGAVTHHPDHGHQLIWARQTILATGGCGRLYRESTNPEIATGDGHAAAYRAGAQIADVEMMQFHPTTLYVAGASRMLISEAVRGEGAYLVDRNGHRFMEAYHPDAELAPRDVVSRAIITRMRETHSNAVYLDVRHLGRDRFTKRFPHIARTCADFEIDPAVALIPIRPSAHYTIGGVVTQLDGTANIEGLLCCGEAACTGMHGANRLASNSLLEGLVLGAETGATAGKKLDDFQIPLRRVHMNSHNAPSLRTELDLPDIRHSLKSLMWRNVGIERNRDHLAEARDIIDFWGHYVLDKTFDDPNGWEIQNMLGLARLIARAALERTRSLGVHYRIDDDGKHGDTLHHITLQRSEKGARLTRTDVNFEPSNQDR